MKTEVLEFDGGRRLLLCSFESDLHEIINDIHGGFSVMLPAFDRCDIEMAKRASFPLLDAGCLEFCCVGGKSEVLHDELDEIIENRGLADIATTWHEDISDACEYFLNAPGGGGELLVGIVEGRDRVVAGLRLEIEKEKLE